MENRSSPMIDQLMKIQIPPQIFECFPLQARPRASRRLIILVNTEELTLSRSYCQNCLIGVLIDIRKFSVRIVQNIINRAWRLRDVGSVVGRQGNNYVIHFNNAQDLQFIWQQIPWSLDGALVVCDL